MRALLVCEPGFLIGNNKLGVKVCWRVLRQDKGKADVACVLILTQASSDTELGATHCPHTPHHPTRRLQTETQPKHSHPHHHPRNCEITLWLFLFTSAAPPPPAALKPLFISQTSVGKGKSPISQGLSFKFHHWDSMQTLVTAEAAVYYFIVASLFAGD